HVGGSYCAAVPDHAQQHRVGVVVHHHVFPYTVVASTDANCGVRGWRTAPTVWAKHGYTV
ncbi:hypothetical protein H4R23_003375, partial [Coemansia sp. Cherry 401B]